LSTDGNRAIQAGGSLHLFSRRIIKKAGGTKLSEFTLRIDGMHCGSCVRRVTQALNLSEGIEVVEVQIGAARLRSASEPAPVERAIAALAKAGYSARLDQ
jgi:copper chaperone